MFTSIVQSDIGTRSFYFSILNQNISCLRLKLLHWLFKNNPLSLCKPADIVSSPGRWAEQKHCTPPVVTSRPVVVALDADNRLIDKESAWVKLRGVNMIIRYIHTQKQTAVTVQCCASSLCFDSMSFMHATMITITMVTRILLLMFNSCSPS